MRIFILGNKGMLGRYVYSYLKHNKYDVIGVSKDDIDVSTVNDEKDLELFFKGKTKKQDVVVNCIGVIKPMINKYGIINTIKINSLFPHYLSNVCEKEDIKLIHITTDCVFSGKDGWYSEDSPHDCDDIYGKTKSLGEPINSTVIRTSIIGEEIGQKKSLVEWVKSMKNNIVNGYDNHKWNGMTCLQLAKIIEDIIVNNKFWKGVRHITSPDFVSKYELVLILSEIYGLNINVIKTNTVENIDRRLKSKYDLFEYNFKIPPIKEQIMEMKNFYSILESGY